MDLSENDAYSGKTDKYQTLGLSKSRVYPTNCNFEGGTFMTDHQLFGHQKNFGQGPHGLGKFTNPTVGIDSPLGNLTMAQVFSKEKDCLSQNNPGNRQDMRKTLKPGLLYLF